MLEFFQGINPVLLALIASGFTYLMTLLGATLVFFVVKVNEKLLDAMLGFASGVMIAASF